jgi:hypothetical protein
MKEEEVMRLAQRRRPSGSQSVSRSPARNSSLSSRSHRPSTAPGGGSTVAGSGGAKVGAKLESELRKRQAVLDEEVEKQLQRQDATERLERELQQRERAVAEKESALAERHALELRRMRNSHMMDDSMASEQLILACIIIPTCHLLF